MDLITYLAERTVAALEGLQPDDRSDVYAMSLLVQGEDQAYVKPTATLSTNVQSVDGLPSSHPKASD